MRCCSNTVIVMMLLVVVPKAVLKPSCAFAPLSRLTRPCQLRNFRPSSRFLKQRFGFQTMLFASDVGKADKMQGSGTESNGYIAEEKIRIPGADATISPLSQSIASSVECLISSSTPHASAASVVLTLSVSGGCDSMALLHATMEWYHAQRKVSGEHQQTQHSRNIQIQVMHFDHQQRGEESDADRDLVQATCDAYGIPCRVETWQDYLGKLSLNNQNSSIPQFSQDMARQWRRERLLKVTEMVLDESSEEEGRDDASEVEKADTPNSDTIGIILTAHHRDDSIESLLLKALRGVHLLNLSGIVAHSSVSERVFLARPWVDKFFKQDLVDYMIDRKFEWREDESNSSPKYLRNRVRNELVPLLQDLTSGGLDSRLEAWVQQSQQFANDLYPRVQAHLIQVYDEKTGSFDWSKSVSLVKQGEGSQLVQSQALHRWIVESASNYKRSVSGFNGRGQENSLSLISNDSLNRLLFQLQDYPGHLELIIEIGRGWSVQRKGNLLKLLHGDEHLEIVSSPKKLPWKWKRLVDISDDKVKTKSASGSIATCVPIVWLDQELEFAQMSVRAVEAMRKSSETRAVWFVPPWKSSPVKLRQFLRGQGVPLEARDDSTILVALRKEKDPTVVAVEIESSRIGEREWIVHKDFHLPEGKEPAIGYVPLLVQSSSNR